MSEATTETKATEDKAFESNPKPIHNSLAKYVTEHSGVEVTPAQAEALLKFHSTWQKSPERKAEREQEVADNKAAAEAKKAERERLAAEKKAAKEAEAAKKAAEKAAKKDDDSDLDDLDGNGVDDIDELGDETPKPSRRRKAAAAVADDDDL